MSMTKLLDVEGLSVALPTKRGPRKAVDDVSFTVGAGEIVGIAGESGSGKTMTALTLLGLLPPGSTTTGSARFDGEQLLGRRARELRTIRGRQIAMVSQDPATSLHPMLRVETQLTEHMRHHLGVSRSQARARAAELLDTVRIPDPARALRAYPGQFSGGMRQRIAIASALACEPRLLLADEPTTALDVTVQAGILRLLDRLRRERGLAVVIITHDLGVMSAVTDRVCVMYAGRMVEVGPRSRVLAEPRHPYTRGLLAALPHPESGNAALRPIPGSPPTLGAIPAGCAFHPRCEFRQDSCATQRPELARVGFRGHGRVEGVDAGHSAACPIDPWGGGDE
jgi:oligopeptide transport system ATP-binding protein